MIFGGCDAVPGEHHVPAYAPVGRELEGLKILRATERSGMAALGKTKPVPLAHLARHRHWKTLVKTAFGFHRLEPEFTELAGDELARLYKLRGARRASPHLLCRQEFNIVQISIWINGRGIR